LGVGPKPFGADNQHRRLRVDIVGRHSAEARDELARVLAPERTELSGKNDELTRKRTRLDSGEDEGKRPLRLMGWETKPLQDDGE
jgi:hypothetical protein